MEAVAKLPADGYALLQLDSEHVSALPHLYKSRHYIPLEKFDLVAPVFYTPFMIAVSSQSPWKNVTDLVNAAKAKPDRLTYGRSEAHTSELQSLMRIPYAVFCL